MLIDLLQHFGRSIVLLCIEQKAATHLVYEIEEPAWGSIGALTEIDVVYAQAHARKLVQAGAMQPGTFTIVLYDGGHGCPLDHLQAQVTAPPEAA
jgi:hypothetical protein